MNYEKIIEGLKSFIAPIMTVESVESFFRNNAQGLFFGILVASSVFLIRNSKFVKEFMGNKKIYNTVNNVMEDEGLNFDEAKDFLIACELSENLRITNKAWFVTPKQPIYSGYRVSFKDKELGNISGYFIGLIEPELYGYDNLYVLRLRDGTLRQAPISYVEVDTIYVYERKRKL